MKEETFTGRGGTRSPHAHLASGGNPRARPWCSATAFLRTAGNTGGRGEQLSAAGFAVYAYDHRGRGKSEGPRLFVNDIAEYTDDLGTFVALVKSREPGLNVGFCWVTAWAE